MLGAAGGGDAPQREGGESRPGGTVHGPWAVIVRSVHKVRVGGEAWHMETRSRMKYMENGHKERYNMGAWHEQGRGRHNS